MLKLSLVLLAAGVVYGRDNGVGRLPALGWNTWCVLSSCGQEDPSYPHTFHDVCNEHLVKSVAQAMIDNGMQSAGYTYVNLDDCWEAAERTSDGALQGDPERFPNGMKALGDWLHAKNFKFGIYVSGGYSTCSTGGRPVKSIPGSITNIEGDMETLASWGVDYIKMDWCGTTDPETGVELMQPNVTTAFAAAQNATGRPTWLNFHCENDGLSIPSWCTSDGNSWRMQHDHHDTWSNTASIIETLKHLANYGRPYGWLDPDFLMTAGAGCDKNVTGLRCPGQTETEYLTEVSLWSMAAAPLLVATDVRNLTAFMKKALLNTEIIAIDQDPLGIAGGLVANWGCSCGSTYCQVWSRPLHDGTFAVALYNAHSDSHHITVKWEVIPGSNFTSDSVVSVRDVWAQRGLGSFTGNLTVEVESHQTLVYKVSASA